MSFFIKDLKCQNTSLALGIDTKVPLFSWVLVSGKNETVQTAYKLEIVSENKELIYKSNWVNSSVSFNVQADLSKKIEPFSKYFFVLSVKDNFENVAVKKSYFTTGVFKTYQWSADWFKIWYDFGKVGYTRKEFVINKEIDYAYAYTGAVGDKVNSVIVYCNGVKINDNVNFPGASEYFRAFYSTTDIKSRLRYGKNTIGFVFSRCASLILKIKYKDGSFDIISSSQFDWKFNDDGPFLLGYAEQMTHGKSEVFDSRKDFTAVFENDFDDSTWGFYDKPSPEISFSPLFISAQHCTAKVHKTIIPVEILEHNDYILVDFGTNMSGFVSLDIIGSPNLKLKIQFAEKLDDNSQAIITEWAPAFYEYIFSSDEKTTIEPQFMMIGFRYVKITGCQDKLTTQNIRAHLVYSDINNGSSFTCSNESLNKIYKVAMQSFKSNLVNIPTDCPERERRGWTADAFAVSAAQIYNFDLLNFYKQWFISYNDSQRKNGWIPVELPIPTDDCVDLNWPMSAVFIPFEILKHYNDIEFCKTHYKVSKGYVDLLLELCDDDLKIPISLYSYKDWLAEEKATPEFLSAAYFFRALDLISTIALAVGKNEDSSKYSHLAQMVKDRINRDFLHFESNCIYYDNNSQSSNAHALGFNVCFEKHKTAICDSLVKDIELKQRNTTGFMGTSILLDVLSTCGAQEYAYDLITNENLGGWLYLINNCNATTFPENYNGSGSQNHAFLGSAPGLWLMNSLSGIRPIKNGFELTQIKPFIPSDITNFSTTVSTNKGDVSVKYRRKPSEKFEITIPIGMIANFTYKTQTLELNSGVHLISI